MAAEAGDARAQSCLGTMYLDGVGVTKHPEIAWKYFTMAAEAGYVIAQNVLAKARQYSIMAAVAGQNDLAATIDQMSTLNGGLGVARELETASTLLVEDVGVQSPTITQTC